MGYGDYLMLSGQVRELKMFPQFKVVCPEVEQTGFFRDIFRGNPNISLAREIDQNTPCIQLPRVEVGVPDEVNSKLVWKPHFQAIRGDLFLADDEIDFARTALGKINPHNKKVVVVNPFAKSEQAFTDGSVKAYTHHVNKEWPTERYAALIAAMPDCLFIRPTAGPTTRPFLANVHDIVSDYRQACALIHLADIYLGCEGGLHHAAAALQKPAVVIFGGWISPLTTGYGFHDNLFIGAPDSACGSLSVCSHCDAAMETITVDAVAARLALALGI